MILRSLTLHNIGVYEGRQRLDLTPDDGKPVVLVGGLNGGGKTTLLDALQLALYGNRARTSNRNGLSYEKYLDRTMNRRRGPSDGSGIEIELSHHSDGREVNLRVVRTFTSTGSGVREELAVFRNGELDRMLTENWADYIEEILPLDIAQLFFFDGEQIKDLAESDQAGALVRTAIYALLGLNLIERLSSDLTTLARRKRVSMHDAETKERIDALQAQLEMAEAQRKEVTQELAAVRTIRERAVHQLEQIESEYRSEGGELYDRRHELEEQLARVRAEIEEAKDRLRSLASTSAPLLLVEDLIAETLEQGRLEAEVQDSQRLNALLSQRDEQITELLGDHLGKRALETVASVLRDDREARRAVQNGGSYLGLDPTALLLLTTLDEDRSTQGETLRDALDAHANLESKAAQIERELNAVPNPERVQAIIAKRDKAQEALEEADRRVEVLEELIARAGRDVEASEAALVREIERQVDEDFDQEANSRIVTHADKAQHTLERFQEQLIAQHLTRIEQAVTDAFQRLMRKQTLVDRVAIDPDDFTVHVIAQDGIEIPAERLSAGERQLLAVALLWGLAIVSERALPTIVDTPLGRLDSIHREYLADRYFPEAAQQVILLSTDEEIDQDLHHRLSAAIAKEYWLDYDDSDNATTIRPGYFWQEAGHGN